MANTRNISKEQRLAPPPESPPGCIASLLLLLDVRALPLHRAVAALGVAASLLERAVEAVAVGAVGALVTLRPSRDIGESTLGSCHPLKGLLVASKAQSLVVAGRLATCLQVTVGGGENLLCVLFLPVHGCVEARNCPC